MASIYDDAVDLAGNAVGAVKRGAGQVLAETGRAAQAIGLPGQSLQQTGQSIVDANPAAAQSFSAAPVTSAVEGIAGSVPAIGAHVAGAAAGAKLGSVLGPRGEVLGGIVGGLAPDFVQSFGGNLERQDQQGVNNPGAAAIAALPQAALNQIALGPAAKVLRIPGAASLETGIANPIGDAAAHALGYGAIGAGTGVAQEALTRAAAGQSISDQGAEDAYGEAAIQGGIAGGALGGVSRGTERALQAHRDAAAAVEEENAAANPPKDTGTPQPKDVPYAPPDMADLSPTERHALDRALNPEPLTVNPQAGAVSKALARGADDGAVEGVTVQRPTLPVLEDPAAFTAIDKAPDLASFTPDKAPVYTSPVDPAVTFHGSKGLTGPERSVEARAAEKVTSDPAAAVEAYKAIPGTDNGRIINTDEAREIFPDYSAGPDARSKNAFAVHEPASFVAKEVFRQALDAPVREGYDPAAIFTSGGTGAGKSSVIKRIPGLEGEFNKADMIYDGNLQSFAGAKDKIDQTLASGRRVDIININRDPVESFVNGALPRAAREDYGRTVPYDAHTNTHIGSAQTLLQLAEHYKDNPNVSVRVINNADKVAVGNLSDVARTASMDHNALKDQLKTGLEQARSEGKVPDRVYDYYKSQAQDDASGSARAQSQALGEVQRGEQSEGTGGQAGAGDGSQAERQQGSVAQDGAQGGLARASVPAGEPGSREKPFPHEREGNAPLGSWVEAGFKHNGESPLYQVRRVPVSKLLLPEVDSKGGIGPEKQGYVARYTEAMKRGEQFPNLRGAELDDGRVKITDGNRRSLAALAAGVDHLNVAVFPREDGARASLPEGSVPQADESPASAAERERVFNEGGSTGLPGKQVKQLSDRLTRQWKNGPGVEVVNTHADLPEALRKAIPEGADGAYDGTGKVYLVADKLNTARDVRRVIAHEAYAHYGIKGVLGEKFGDFYDRVQALKDSDPDIKRAADSVRERYGDLEPQVQSDEIVAHLAENYATLKGRAKIMMAQVVAAVRNFLRDKLNVKLDWSHAEVLDLIAKSKGAIEGRNAAEKAKNLANLGNQGQLTRASVPAPGQSFDGWTRASDKLDRYLGASAKERIAAYKSVAGQKGDQLRTLFQDYFLPVRRVQEAIAAKGGKITDDSDVYGREELYYGRTGERLRQLEDDHVKPLIADLTKRGVSQEDLELYLYAKFAPERNARIAAINEKMPDGGSGMTNADAAKIIDDFKTSGQTDHLEALSKRVYDLNELRVKALEDAGLIGKDEAAVWRDDKHYVPLKGVAEANPDDDKVQRPPIGAGFSVGGKEAWRALGRRSRASDILANSVAQTNQAIIRAEKNRVAQSLLKLATDNPNEKLWAVDKQVNKPGFDRATGEVKYTNRPEPDAVIAKVDGEEHRINIYDPRLMESMKNLGAAKVGAILRGFSSINRFLSLTRTTLAPEFVLANLARDVQEASVNTVGKLGPESAARMVAGIPQSIRAMWGQLGNKSVGGEWGRHAQEFAETGGMTSFVAQRTVEEQQKRLESMIAGAKGGNVEAVKNMLRATRDRIEHANSTVENAVRLSAYAEARRKGASTDQAARFAKNLTVNFNRKGSAGAAINAMWLFYNASIQGSARFLHAIKSPKVQAMMGAIAATGYGLSYYNRVVGGKDDDGQDLWDKIPDYEKQRNLIIMDAFGKGTHLKIPMPYTYNLPFLLGSELANMVHGKQEPTKAAANLINAFTGAFNPIGDFDISKDPTEQAVNLASPTALKPFLDLAFNKNHFDSPITPEDSPFAKVKTPDSQRFFPSTNPGAVWLANQLNTLSGGNKIKAGAIDVSPASMTYLFDYLTGGTGSFVDRTVTAASLAASGQDVPLGKIPFLRTFAGQLDDRRVNDTFYKARDDVSQNAALGKLIAKPGAFPDATPGDKKDGRFGLALNPILMRTDAELSKINDAIKYERSKEPNGFEEGLKKIAVGDQNPKVKALQERQRALMLQFNRAYWRTKEAQQAP